VQESPVGVGQRLGKYVITEKLGEGGMGMVFAGLHEGLGREVAIKTLRSELAQDAQMMPRFQAEAEAVSRIGHANIVAVYDFGRLPDGSMYYVMERIRGEALSHRMLRQPPLTRDEAVHIFGQICRALQATHARKIVHRDLKPDNVILQAQTNGPVVAKVLDFGIAMMRTPGAERNLTAVGTLMGTPAYMAPEQIMKAHLVDGRADLYSLGAMLYQLLTGQPPFVGEPMVVLTRHISELPVPPSQCASREVTPALDALVMRTLAKSPDERPADAATFLAELERAWPPDPKLPVIDSLAPSPSGRIPIVAPAPTVAPPSRSRAALFIGLAAGALALGAGAFLFLRKPNPSPPIEKPSDPAVARATRLLSEAIASGGVPERRAAVDAIGDANDRAGLDLIVRALDDANPEVRRAAASAAARLGKPSDTALRAALTTAAQSSGGAVAVELAVARLAVGDAAAGEDLTRASGSPTLDPAVRLSAAVALAGHGQLKAPRLHAAIAAAPTVKRAARWRAYVALFSLGDDATFANELERALKGKDPVARMDAAETLARVGDEDGKRVLDELSQRAADPLDRVEAAAVLAELGDAAAVPRLDAALTAQQPPVRARAAAAFGRLARPDRTHLVPLLDDLDATPRLAAAAALQAISAR
jgi:serine/threonine-protein kinase